MWSLEKNAEFDRRLKKFSKRHRTETKNALDNLAAYLASLHTLKPQQIIRGYIHPEGLGVFAMDESGPNHPNKPVRVYVYPDEETQTLHVLTIGDKNSQQDDVRLCHQFVESLRTARKDSQEGNH